MKMYQLYVLITTNVVKFDSINNKLLKVNCYMPYCENLVYIVVYYIDLISLMKNDKNISNLS